MARVILTVLLIISLNVLVSCKGVDSGQSQLVPTAVKEAVSAAGQAVDAGENDLVEQMIVNRRAYRQGLEQLVEHYNKKGDNMKYTWAKRELSAMDAMPQYNYIIEAGVAGPNLRAGTTIPEADYLYAEAVRLDEQARLLIAIRDKEVLRQALDRYNQVIRKHPTSDKIDDAAYQAAEIYEYFKDYTIAILYYQRCQQWNPDTTYPAKFRAAFILDRRLHRIAEALEAYQEAVKAVKGGEYRDWKRYAEKRIKEISAGMGSQTVEE